VAEVSSSAYWRDSFQCVFKSKQLTEYTVMDIEPIMEKDRVQFPGQGQLSYKVSSNFNFLKIVQLKIIGL